MKCAKNKSLLIVGMGQYGLVAKEIAEAMGVFDCIRFLDDSFNLSQNQSDAASTEQNSLIGSTKDIEKFAGEFSYGFVAIGNPDTRRRFLEQLELNCITPAILVHPRAFVSSGAQLHKGCCVEPMATVQTGAVVAVGSFISSGAVIRHDAFIGEFCHVDCNAVVESLAVVPANTKIPCNSVFCREQGQALAGQKF